MKKGIIFPLICMLVGMCGCVCDFVTSTKEIDMEDMIANEVAKQLEARDSE